MGKGVEERLAEPGALPGGQAVVESVVCKWRLDERNLSHQAPDAHKEH